MLRATALRRSNLPLSRDTAINLQNFGGDEPQEQKRNFGRLATTLFDNRIKRCMLLNGTARKEASVKSVQYTIFSRVADLYSINFDVVLRKLISQ